MLILARYLLLNTLKGNLIINMNTPKTNSSAKQKLAVILVSLASGFLFMQSISAGALYRWVDNQGVVHFGDRIPSQYAKLKRQVMNDQGRIIKTLAAEKTANELANEAAERDRQAKLKQEAAIKAERNRVLLASYANTADIDAVATQKRNVLEKQLSLLDVNLGNVEQQQKAIENRINVINSGSAPDKTALIAKQNAQLAKTNENLLEISQKRTRLQTELKNIDSFYEQEKQDLTRLMTEKMNQNKANNQVRY